MTAMSADLSITRTLAIPLSECEFTAVRAQGSGGQNVNKVSSAIHLRFDVRASSLPEDIRQRLLARKDRRITGDGVVIIKAQQFRSQEQNRGDALRRLQELLRAAVPRPRPRKRTRPPAAAKRRRLDDKLRRGRLKALRRSTED
jgi:ribosome-associated protein